VSARNTIIILLYLFCLNQTFPAKPDLIVAADGSGDFVSIQDALNAVPEGLTKRFIIFIKNGTYNEKLFIEKSNIAIVGEDSGKTKIIFAELRKNWQAKHPDDYGSAVINIKDSVTGILLSSLTIYNNYGNLYGDHDHAFAIRAGLGVTRIIFDNCRIISGGGDTVSLWNTDDGMYYHNNSYFEGWVDYICPRGYCYIDNSSFFGHNLTASIWHDGSKNEDQKFVLNNCSFDGVKGFPLGRFHRDAQFFLLNCTFSENMADKDIFFSPSNPPRILQWGENRHYFYNCHGKYVDYDWHKNNFDKVKGNPDPETINAVWTFNRLWDPEKELKQFYDEFDSGK